MLEDLILATMPLVPKYEVEEVLGVIYGSSKHALCWITDGFIFQEKEMVIVPI